MGSWGGLYDGGHGGSLQFCCQGRSIIKSNGIMIKIIIPSIFIEQAFWRSSLCWGLQSCSSWARWRTSSVASSIFLWRSASHAIFSFFLCTCWWIISMSLISWSTSSSWSVGLVAFLFWLRAPWRERVSWFWVQRLQCSSPWRWSFHRRHDEGQCLPKVVERVHQRWAPMMGTCSQMLWVKNKATQNVKH